MRERWSSSSGYGRSPASKRFFLVNCWLTIAPVVAMVLHGGLQEIPVHDRAQKTQYFTLYINHNIRSIMQWDPKVSVQLWLERRRRRVKDTPKAMHQSLVLQGNFSMLQTGRLIGMLTPVLVRKQILNRYLSFPMSTAIGLYSQCCTVCDITLHWSHSECPEVETAKPLNGE